MEQLRQTTSLALSARGARCCRRIRRILGIPDAPRRRALASGFVAGSIVVAIVVLMFVLNACSQTTNPRQKKDEPTTQSVTEEDLKPATDEYRIAKKDLIAVSLNDLQAIGAETVKQSRVRETGDNLASAHRPGACRGQDGIGTGAEHRQCLPGCGLLEARDRPRQHPGGTGANVRHSRRCKAAGTIRHSETAISVCSMR